jgi:hypothetical protein
MNGGSDETDTTRPADRTDTDPTDTPAISTPAIDDASGFGLTMTLLTGVLLAFGYYGVLGVADRGFGETVPAPFYLLALALLFVLELWRRETFDAQALARAAAVTAVFGTLVVLAVEGAAYLWVRPEVALDEFTGVAVLAVSLVVAALAYVAYLSVVESTGRLH